MAEELGIKLKIDTKEGIAKARDEIEKFIHEYKDRSIKLKIFDKGDFANLSENIKQVSNQVNNLSQVLGSKLEVRSLDEVNKQFGVMLTRVDSLEKVKVTGEGMEAFTQEIVKGVDAAGKLITATRNLDKTGKIRIREKNDYAGEAKDAEKLAKAKEKIADAEEKNIQRLEMQRIKTVAKRISDAERAAKAESNSIFKAEEAYARLQNRLMRIDSSKVYSMLMGKDSNLSDARSDIATKMKALFTEMENGTLTIEKLKQSGIIREIDKLGANLEVAKNKMGGFTAELLSSAAAFTKWYLLGGLISGFKRSLESGIQTIIDLDTAMVELRKVTDETEQTYNNFYFTANKTAKALGVEEIVAPLYREVSGVKSLFISIIKMRKLAASVNV